VEINYMMLMLLGYEKLNRNNYRWRLCSSRLQVIAVQVVVTYWVMAVHMVVTYWVMAVQVVVTYWVTAVHVVVTYWVMAVQVVVT
jgi:hypothetical protein